MFKLLDKAGNVILMKNGKPFIYTSRALAQMGRKLLEAERKTSLSVISA